MALTLFSGRYPAFDDIYSPFRLGAYGYNNVVALGTYSPQPFSLIPRSNNPFKSTLPLYGGRIGSPNEIRPQLRPANDRLDRLVALAVDKLDVGVRALKDLAQQADSLKTELRDAQNGGDPTLREQIKLANMEIHRLRCLLVTGVGKDAEFQADAPAFPGADAYPPPPPSANGEQQGASEFDEQYLLYQQQQQQFEGEYPAELTYAQGGDYRQAVSVQRQHENLEDVDEDPQPQY